MMSTASRLRRRVDGVATASHRWRRVDGVASLAWPSGPTHRYDKLVEIGADADALRARVEGRAQNLVDYNLALHQKAGYASPSLDNLTKAHKALASSTLSPIRSGPTGTERAENNLEPNYNRERHKAGFQELGHLVNDFSDWLGDGGS